MGYGIPNYNQVKDLVTRRAFQYLDAKLDPISTVVTGLPSTWPTFDGSEVTYIADATNGVVWRFKYRATSASAFKWEFVGGNPLRANTVPFVTTTTNAATPGTWINIAGGVTITNPLAGDWYYAYEINGSLTGPGAQNDMRGGMGIGASGNGSQDGLFGSMAAAAVGQDVQWAGVNRLGPGITAGSVWSGRLSSAGLSTAIFVDDLIMSLWPLRVG